MIIQLVWTLLKAKTIKSSINQNDFQWISWKFIKFWKKREKFVDPADQTQEDAIVIVAFFTQFYSQKVSHSQTSLAIQRQLSKSF